ncbi:uncharacterized protein [Bemisia tabaci]|uniref:uncharacterized protein n=1 Tax=Bemisia tabaci TaxID=7038 RepID=UPI003B28774E
MSDPPEKRFKKAYLNKGSRSRIPRSTRYFRAARARDAETSMSSDGDNSSMANIAAVPPVSGDSFHQLDFPSDPSSSSEESDSDDWQGNGINEPESNSEDSALSELSDEDPQPDNEPPDEEPDPDFDVYNLNAEVLPNVTLTKFEILVMLIHFAIRFKLSDAGVKALIKMINDILGVSIISPSIYMFNKIFTSEKTKTSYLYCSKCLLLLGKKEDCDNMVECPAPTCREPVEPKSANKGHFFVTISVEDQIYEKLRIDGESLLSYRQNRVQSDEVIRDSFDAITFKELEKKASGNSSFVTITGSTDGAEPFENTLSSVWPIQFFLNEISPKERLAPYNVLLGGVWFGKIAPSMATFFTAFIAELQKLAGDGITWFRAALQKHEVTKVYCTNFCCDTPAKAKIMNMILFNGKCSCYFCLHPGDQLEHDPMQIRYGYRQSYEPRTDASLRKNMEDAEATGEIKDGVLVKHIMSSLSVFVRAVYIHTRCLKDFTFPWIPIAIILET